MPEHNYHAPTKCPVCAKPLVVTQLQCSVCETELAGSFSPCKFCSLNEKHLQFIETFLRCRGSIKEVEKQLGISYPTVKNLLESSLEALNLSQKKIPNAVEERREDILNQLSEKKIDVNTALAELEKLKEGAAK